MINTLFNIAKMLIAISPFVLLCLSNKKANLEKPERSKQLLMPLAAVIYASAAMLLVNSIDEWLLRIIADLPLWIAAPARLSWMPHQLGALFIRLSDFVKSILINLNLSFWIAFITNAVIMLAYIAVKKFSIGIMKKMIKTDGKLHTKIAEVFYEYFPEKDKWTVRESYVHTRKLLKVFYYTAIVISVGLMLVSRRFYFDGLMKSVFYPAFGIIIVGELYFYLDGLTKREYSQDILGEDENAYKIVNYSLLRKFLRALFKDKLLTENTSVNNALAYSVTTDEILRKFEADEDQKVVSFAAYYSALNAAGFRIDHNYLYSSLDMLNGKSILFNNPFYNDLIPYAFYPMNRCLLKHKKVLIVLGRHSIEGDIEKWVERGIGSVTNLPFMWKTCVLTQEKQDADIGIITRSDVLNMKLHNANSEFLSNVGFFVVIEPSRLIATAQIGLNLIAKLCKRKENDDIVYCICDKNCDGLVDTMSHILMTSITEVSATNKHLGTSSYMCWETDDEYLHHRMLPNISRYLGIGTELSFAALKNQVSKTWWFGGEVFPVTDISWIAKQYYYDLTKYAGLPTGQKEMDERFKTTSNYWSAEVSAHNYMTVEDEAFNMFEILRDFSTRTTEQGFINVISSDYLLRDYMADNASIFQTDAKAIPCIVPDYVRSRRNTILKLMLMMSMYPVSVDVLSKELSLVGIKVYNVRKQLWYELYCCYAELSAIAQLPEDYKTAVEEAALKSVSIESLSADIILLVFEEHFNFETGKMEKTYAIRNSGFIRSCVSELKSAGYVAEDEKGEKYYLGSELNGHIYQKYLPGQFFTFGGKYYEMQYLTADGKVLVRRAAEHINARPAYRQIRTYELSAISPSGQIGAQKNISGLKVTKEYADIKVSTDGYYQMNRYSDFKSARKVLFEGDVNGIPARFYHNKEILRIELPELEGKISDKIRYTIATLFNEIFKSVFAENHAYIAALTDDSFIGENVSDKPLTYSLTAAGCELQKNCIYIIEDSQLDLGLTVAVERNLERIFKIVQDYLDWHMETLEQSLNPPPEPQPPVVFEEPEKEEEPEKKKKKGIFAAIGRGIKKIIEKIKGRFKKKPKKEVSDAEAGGEKPEPPKDDASGSGAESVKPENGDNGGEAGEIAEKEPAKTVESPYCDEIKTPSENKNTSKGGFNVERKPYHERYYLLYGGSDEAECLDLPGTLEYLNHLGMSRNALKQARDGKKIAELVEATFKPGKPDARYCDFCGAEIYGVEYETLSDGRDRCLTCGRTAIKTGEEFRKIFDDVKRNMEAFFGIRINAGIRVEMVNSQKLHKRLGEAFIPTTKCDGRVLGVAISDKNGYTLLVENGSPRMASMLTMAHELTHIWQYINWNDKAIRKKYGKKLRLEIYEGMAKWVEIQYAYLINEPGTAKREEIITAYRDDEYGRGFLRYRANYPFSTGTVITKPTPFMNVDEPLDPQYCGSFTVVMPTNGTNAEDDKTDDGAKPSGGSSAKPAEPVKGPVDRNPETFRRYAYELLDDSDKTVYELILNAINNFKAELTELPAGVSDERIKKILDYIQRDHPEIFWFKYGATYYFDPNTHVVSKIEFKYCMSQEEQKNRQKKIDSAVKPFMASIFDNMSDYEVVLRIYENIIRLVDYDTIGLEKQKKTETSPEVPDDLRSIYGVFVDKKAVCAGYAKATQYLLNMVGIECTYVLSSDHAWNLLKLEGDYYHLDTTWGDGSDTKKDKIQTNAIGYDCFCITTEELSRLESHTPVPDFTIPECTATKCNYHRRHGLFFEEYSYERARKIVCDFIACGKTDISFKFASKNAYREARRELIDNGKFREAIQYSNLRPGHRVDTSYSYSANDDRLSIRFFLKKL